MFAAYERMGFTGLEAISAKWIVAGVVAAGAGVAVASKDKKTSQNYQEQQQQQQVQQQQNQQNGGGNNGAVPCPTACSFTGRWF